MSQNGVYDLLKMLEIAVDEGYNILQYTIVNKKEIETLIDRVYAALPMEVQDAKLLLRLLRRGALLRQVRHSTIRHPGSVSW